MFFLMSLFFYDMGRRAVSYLLLHSFHIICLPLGTACILFECKWNLTEIRVQNHRSWNKQHNQYKHLQSQVQDYVNKNAYGCSKFNAWLQRTSNADFYVFVDPLWPCIKVIGGIACEGHTYMTDAHKYSRVDYMNYFV